LADYDWPKVIGADDCIAPFTGGGVRLFSSTVRHPAVDGVLLCQLGADRECLDSENFDSQNFDSQNFDSKAFDSQALIKNQ
jgi:hypothetical protein